MLQKRKSITAIFTVFACSKFHNKMPQIDDFHMVLEAASSRSRFLLGVPFLAWRWPPPGRGVLPSLCSVHAWQEGPLGSPPLLQAHQEVKLVPFWPHLHPLPPKDPISLGAGPSPCKFYRLCKSYYENLNC